MQRIEAGHLRFRNALIGLESSLTEKAMSELRSSQRELTETRSEELVGERRLILGKVVRIPLPSKKY